MLTSSRDNFDGQTFDPVQDVRLNGQLERVFWTLCDKRWHTLSEIAQLHQEKYNATDTEAAISARIRDFRKPKFGGFTVESRRRHKGLWEYRLV